MSRAPSLDPAGTPAGSEQGRGLSRRTALGLLGGGAVAVGATALVAGRLESPGLTRVSSTSAVVPFLGEHQAGITTPAQDRLHFAAFDVTTRDRAQLVALLQAVERGGGAADPGPPGRRSGRCPAGEPAGTTGRHG